MLILFYTALLLTYTHATPFYVRNMLLFMCDNSSTNIVAPREEPFFNAEIRTASPNHTLRARGATVRCVGKTILSDPTWSYILGYLGPDDVVPVVNPTVRGTIIDEDASWRLSVAPPTEFTVEVVFSLSRRVLPSSRYRLFDDGVVRVSYVVASGDEWCSTVRFIEMTDDLATFVLDFNQMYVELAFAIQPDTPVHLFWVRNTDTTVSKVCMNHIGAGLPSCIVLSQDDGPITTIYSEEYTTSPSFGMYTMYLQGMFEEMLSDEQMEFLDRALPHFAHRPTLRSAISGNERLKYHKVMPLQLS